VKLKVRELREEREREGERDKSIEFCALLFLCEKLVGGVLRKKSPMNKKEKKKMKP